MVNRTFTVLARSRSDDQIKLGAIVSHLIETRQYFKGITGEKSVGCSMFGL